MRYPYPIALLLVAAGTAAAQLPPSHMAFDKDAVHEIRLTFAQSDYWQQLTTNYESNQDDVPYISASLQWGDYKFDSVGVRFKGNSSYSGASNSKKKPFRIKLNEFVKGQKIDSEASFSLSNGWNDPSFVREKAYYELAAAAGLKAPRSTFAALYINGEYWGLYILSEVVNGDFLKAFLGKGEDEGNLYKGDMGASFAYLGDDKAKYKQTFEKQSNEEADDWSDLIAFTKTLNETPTANLKAALDPILDVDSLLTALAIDNLTANLDSYVGMGQNFYFYKRPSDGRWMWIVWDPSLAFGGLAQGLTVEQMKTMALEWVTTTNMGGGQQGQPGQTGQTSQSATTSTVTRPLATRLWEVAEYKARYREIYRYLVEKVFFPDIAVARMVALRDMIRTYVDKDPNKLVTMDQFEQAMTSETTAAGGGDATTPPTGGTTPPTGGATPPTGGTTPPTGGTTPPTGGTTPPTGGTTPPTGGTTPPTGGTTPPTDGTTPPTGGGPGGNQQGGGMGSTPGIQPFITARVASVKAQLDAK
jgi:spore coat protein CotH